MSCVQAAKTPDAFATVFVAALFCWLPFFGDRLHAVSTPFGCSLYKITAMDCDRRIRVLCAPAVDRKK